ENKELTRILARSISVASTQCCVENRGESIMREALQSNEAIDPPPQVGTSVINLDDKRLSHEGEGARAIAGDDERLIREGEAAVERFKKSREQILPMARGLAAAKRKYPATREFGAWL